MYEIYHLEEEQRMTATMIDGHCHAWRTWPYDLGVRDAFRGDGQALLERLGAHQITRAVIVAAGIGRAHPETNNSDNNAYVAELVEANRDRLDYLADFDSFWSDEHHTAGAAQRAAELLDGTAAVGLSHYVRGDDDGWFLGSDAARVFTRLERDAKLFSVHLDASWFDSVFEVARRHPEMPVVIHHQAQLAPAREQATHELAAFLSGSELPNVYVKVSGFHYLAEKPWAHPFPEVHPVFRSILAAYGDERLIWGSDFPAGGRYVTYQQSFELIRDQFPELAGPSLDRIYGENMQRLLNAARVG